MAGRTISNLITISVTLGSGSYASPLTITPAGSIDPTAGGSYGATGLVAVISGGSVLNQGQIGGGNGSYGGLGRGGNGGAGVSLAVGSSLTNTGRIYGGHGGGGRYHDGFGGAGVAAASSSRVTNDGVITGGNGAPAVYLTSATLTNDGAIAGGGDGGFGVYLAAGSALINEGTIIGGSGGPIQEGPNPYYPAGGTGLLGKNSTLTNDGTIFGGIGFAGGNGLGLINSTLTNNGTIASGSIGINGGGYGIDATNSTLTNTGMIAGYFYGVYLDSGGVVTNVASAVITAYCGVSFADGGTLINAGTITSLGPDFFTSAAVRFKGTGVGRLVDDPGAVFVGSIIAAGSSVTLELASAAGTGTITGLGSSFSGFGTVTADPGARWVVEGSVTGGGAIGLGAGSDLTFDGGVAATAPVRFTAGTGTLGVGDPAGFAAAVFGLQAGDAIDFTSISSTGSIVAGVDGANDLTLSSGGVVLADIKLDPAQHFIGDDFHAASDGSGGTVVTETPLCFLAGTLIATPAGETPIERLGVGDMVVTASGAVRRIVWIGRGRVLATRNRRSAATPVIVCKGALADNVPHRDLKVTKAHALCLEGVLIPAEFLVNHRSIHWDDMAQEVALYHIELETHDVLLANGAPAESYRDDGNRWLFGNANSGWHLPPKRSCLPVLTGGDVVDTVWQRLLERAGPRPSVPLTDDPDLHLVVDGGRIDAESRTDAPTQRGDIYVFRVTRVTGGVRIVSRAAAPQELGLGRDPRTLGVAVRRIIVRRSGAWRVIAADDPALAEGFHAFEAANGLRWTDGDAVLPAALFAGFAAPLEVVVQCGATARFVDDGMKRLVA